MTKLWKRRSQFIASLGVIAIIVCIGFPKNFNSKKNKLQSLVPQSYNIPEYSVGVGSSLEFSLDKKPEMLRIFSYPLDSSFDNDKNFSASGIPSDVLPIIFVNPDDSSKIVFNDKENEYFHLKNSAQNNSVNNPIAFEFNSDAEGKTKVVITSISEGSYLIAVALTKKFSKVSLDSIEGELAYLEQGMQAGAYPVIKFFVLKNTNSNVNAEELVQNDIASKNTKSPALTRLIQLNRNAYNPLLSATTNLNSFINNIATEKNLINSFKNLANSIKKIEKYVSKNKKELSDVLRQDYQKLLKSTSFFAKIASQIKKDKKTNFRDTSVDANNISLINNALKQMLEMLEAKSVPIEVVPPGFSTPTPTPPVTPILPITIIPSTTIISSPPTSIATTTLVGEMPSVTATTTTTIASPPANPAPTHIPTPPVTPILPITIIPSTTIASPPANPAPTTIPTPPVTLVLPITILPSTTIASPPANPAPTTIPTPPVIPVLPITTIPSTTIASPPANPAPTSIPTSPVTLVLPITTIPSTTIISNPSTSITTTPLVGGMPPVTSTTTTRIASIPVNPTSTPGFEAGPLICKDFSFESFDTISRSDQEKIQIVNDAKLWFIRASKRCTGYVIATGSTSKAKNPISAGWDRCTTEMYNRRVSGCCQLDLTGGGNWILTSGVKERITGTEQLPAGLNIDYPLYYYPYSTRGCSGQVLASGSLSGSNDLYAAKKHCSDSVVKSGCCQIDLEGEGSWKMMDGNPEYDDNKYSANNFNGSCLRYYPLSCNFGFEGVPYNVQNKVPNASCSGNIIATRSMNNSDKPSDAARFCSTGGFGTCCSYDYSGEGTWTLTDGAPVNSNNSLNYAAPCQRSSGGVPTPMPFFTPPPTPTPLPIGPIGPCGIDKSNLNALGNYSDPLQCRIASSKSDYQIEEFGFIGMKLPFSVRDADAMAARKDLVPIYRMNDYSGNIYKTYYLASKAQADKAANGPVVGGFTRIVNILTTCIYKAKQTGTVPIYAADSTTKGLYLSRIEANVTALVGGSKGLWKNKRILGYAYEKLPDDGSIDYGDFGSLYRMYNPIKKEYHYFFESSDGVNYWKEDPTPREIILGQEVGLKVISAGNPTCVEIGNIKLDPHNQTYKVKYNSENDDTSTYARIYTDDSYAECEITHDINTELYRDFQTNLVSHTLSGKSELPHCSGSIDKTYLSYQMVMDDIDLPLTAKQYYESVGDFRLFKIASTDCEKQMTLCRSIKTYTTSLCSVGFKTSMFNDYLADTNIDDSSLSCGANELRYDEAGYVCPTQVAGTLPLSHLTKATLSSHYYTTSDTEKADLIKNGWKFDKIIGYVPGQE